MGHVVRTARARTDPQTLDICMSAGGSLSRRSVATTMRSITVCAAVALASALVVAVAMISAATAVAVALASVTLALAGARRTAVLAAIVLATFALVGVRVDNADRPVATAAGRAH